ncbi:MAG: glycosyltransferase family 4 protein [Candidatus Aenigmarchaeota archaeon]|nr:glycosyltransferase family 4 protein [Candidatus Aenigmarchaeota archaeon]
MKVCFFANAPFDLIKVVEFYKTDIRILEELGFEVKVSNSFSNIEKNADLYFAYWASSGAKAIMYSKMIGKPNILVAAGSDVCKSDKTSTGFDARPYWQKKIIKWTLKNSNAVLVDSKHVLQQARMLGGKNLKLCYFGIDTEKYKPLKIKKEKSVVLVSHVSKHNVERKRIMDILDAMKIVVNDIPDAKFVLIGTLIDGFPAVKERVKNLGLERNVEFHESREMKEKEKIRLVNKSVAFVQPSMHEGFGLAMAEAMACGLPVIVSRKGATPEVAGGAGLYVPVKNPKKLAEAILKVLKNGELVERLGNIGRERIKEIFNYGQRKECIADVVHRLLKA